MACHSQLQHGFLARPNSILMRHLSKIYHSTLKAVQSSRLVRRRLREIGIDKVTDIVAVGKAAQSMLEGALEVLPTSSTCFVLSKHGHASHKMGGPGSELWLAGHPLPDTDGILASEALVKWIQRPKRARQLLLLVSGGTSSLLVSPNPPLGLADMVVLNEALLASGLPIEEINVIRKHLSTLKGGRLGKLLLEFYPRIHQLVLCDVCAAGLDDQELLSLVGSGPAIADPSTVEDASRLLKELNLESSRQHQFLHALKETPKQLTIPTEILADHRLLRRTALEHTPRQLHDPRWPETVQSDISQLTKDWASLALRLSAQGQNGTLVATGEPTVRLGQTAGQGGRCQELALGFAREIAGSAPLSFLAGSSDGTDGPTQYAGAVVTHQTWARLAQHWGEEKLLWMLENHDSSTAFEALPESLLKTGPTGQNINDLFLLQIGEP